MNVVRLETECDKDNKRALPELQVKFRKVDVIGIAYVAMCRDGAHIVRASGKALDNPDMVVGLSWRMLWLLMARRECICRNP